MATMRAQPVAPIEPPSAFRVVRVPPALALASLARLVTPRADEVELERAAEEFREQLTGDGADLSRMWCAVEPGEHPSHPLLGQVVLAVVTPGRAAALYVSGDVHPHDLPAQVFDVPLSQAPAHARHDQRAACTRAVLRWLRAAPQGPGDPAQRESGDDIDVALAQALVEPGATALIDGLLAGGMTRLAELAYLRRDLSRYARTDEPAWPAGVSVRTVHDLPGGWAGAQADLLLAMERSYEGTLDCPALCAIRTLPDTLASHRAVGAFDPRLWSIVYWQGQPHGCMLLSPFPDHDTVELVYLGLGPVLRGQGLGAMLLQRAVRDLTARGSRCLACAVDTTNSPALKLYKAAKFRAFTSRIGLIADVRQNP
jgi:ribosomal protein S18 acetylase RimI-like enzyme